jgi:EAL domain-containing protein (putative c-di-GMP-specific phosphodiesterase class I)/GGDEF domain-containing protein/CheY-like chemotaxis protein
MARKRTTTIRLLLINASDNDAERLVSLFRAAGRVARTHRIISADDLEQALAQEWDLLIVDDDHPELKVEQCLDYLRKHQPRLPALVLRADAELAPLFAAGARDVIAPTDDQRLVQAALRELEHLELVRNLDSVRAQLAEAEQRNALLLGASEKAIAYIADGMLINANAKFAERFGYSDASELDCAAIVDLVAAEEHEPLKALLKSGSGTARLTALRADRSSFATCFELCAASYDGEACLQLTVLDTASPATGADSAGGGDRDGDSGLFSLDYLNRQLELATSGSLILLALDNFTALRRQLGFRRGRELVAAIGQRLDDEGSLPASATLARAGDDCFAVLSDLGGDDAMALAQRLCKLVDDKLFELGEQSLHCTASAGVALVGSGNNDSALDRALRALDDARDQGGGRATLDTAQPPLRPLATDGGESALQEAMEDGRFTLLFQPVISLRGVSGEHYEVLLRMRGDTDELIAPDNFLDSLGVSAANARLDRWLLLEATKRLADSRVAGHDTRLVINLSANALQDESLATWLGVALKAAGLPPHTVILQLREIDVNNYLKPARLFAESVRQLGCRVSLCSFGRGADSLKTVRNLPVDLVQMDQAFTRDLQRSGDASTLKTIVSELTQRDIKVIVPFVENAAVLATLWQVGADFIQGHYLQAPTPEMTYEFTDIA